jgi:hypothetical protein
MKPQPPFLVIREGTSFWVEDRPVDEWTATLQAFDDGCFRDACCYDTTGSRWHILDAGLRRRPSLAQRFLPWRQVSVAIRLGARSQPDLREVLAQLAAVLESGGEFSDALTIAPSILRERFQDAKLPSDIIRIALESTRGDTARPLTAGDGSSARR